MKSRQNNLEEEVKNKWTLASTTGFSGEYYGVMCSRAVCEQIVASKAVEETRAVQIKCRKRPASTFGEKRSKVQGPEQEKKTV